MWIPRVRMTVNKQTHQRERVRTRSKKQFCHIALVCQKYLSWQPENFLGQYQHPYPYNPFGHTTSPILPYTNAILHYLLCAVHRGNVCPARTRRAPGALPFY